MIKEYTLKCANGYRIMVESYNSAQDVVNDCKKRPITNSSFHNMEKEFHSQGDKDWYGGINSYEECLETLKNGYQPIADELKSKIKANLQGQGKRVSFRNDIVGYAPIVPLAVLGVPNSMINSTMKTIKAKVVDVYYDMGTEARSSGDDIVKAGVKLLSTVISLEQQGYRFNLYALQGYTEEKDADMLCIKVKDASQPLDLKRVAFPLAHAAFFRGIGFDWYSKTPKGKYRWGYGRSLYRRKGLDECKKIAKEMFGENAVYISCSKLCENLSNAEKYLEEVLTNAKSY